MFQIYNMCFILRTIFYNGPLTLREVSRLSKCSLSKTSRIVKELEKKKLIRISVKGKSYLLTPIIENTFFNLELLKEEILYTVKILEKYSFLMDELKNIDGKVVIVFGSYASEEADDLSDIDTLTIDGKNADFNLTLKEFRDSLRSNKPTIVSIMKKHVIIKGFETFVEEVIKWKKRNYYGVLK